MTYICLRMFFKTRFLTGDSLKLIKNAKVAYFLVFADKFIPLIGLNHVLIHTNNSVTGLLSIIVRCNKKFSFPIATQPNSDV